MYSNSLVSRKVAWGACVLTKRKGYVYVKSDWQRPKGAGVHG